MMKGFCVSMLSLSLFSVDAQVTRRVFGNPNAIVFDVAVHPARKIIASTSLDTVSVWDYVHGIPICQWRAYQLISIKLRDNRIAGVCVDGSITVWNIDTGEQLITKLVSDNPLTSLVWLDSAFLVIGNDAGQLIKFNTLNGHADYLAKQKIGITALAATHNGQRIISGRTDGWVFLWKLDDLKPISSVRAGKKWVRSIAVADDDKIVVTGGDDRKLRTWKLAAGLQPEYTSRYGSWILSTDYYAPDPLNAITTTGERNGVIKIKLRFGEYKAKINSMVNSVVILKGELPKISAAVATHGEGLLVLESGAFKVK